MSFFVPRFGRIKKKDKRSGNTQKTRFGHGLRRLRRFRDSFSLFLCLFRGFLGPRLITVDNLP